MCSQLSSDHSHDCGRQSFKVVKSIWGPGHGGAHLRSHNSESRANRLRVPSSSASLKPTWATWDPPNVNKQNRSKIVQCQCWEPEFNYTGLRLIFPKQYSGIHTYTVTSTHTKADERHTSNNQRPDFWRKMAPAVKCWPHKHKDLNMTPSTQVENRGVQWERRLNEWRHNLLNKRSFLTSTHMPKYVYAHTPTEKLNKWCTYTAEQKVRHGDTCLKSWCWGRDRQSSSPW